MLKILKLVFIVLTNLAFLRLGSPERRARGREHSKVNWKEERRVNRVFMELMLDLQNHPSRKRSASEQDALGRTLLTTQNSG